MQFEFFFTPPLVSSAKVSASLTPQKNTPLIFLKDSSCKFEMLILEILMKPA